MTTKPPFDRLVRDHGPTVLRVCRAVVGSVDADDVWSETFLAALRAYPELPAGANHEAWLVTIAHRKAIDAVRTRARRAIPLAEPPEVRAEAIPDHPELYGALDTLTERQRQAIAYHHVAGLPYAEVAVILGGSTEAVRRAAADGMAALRTRLGEDHD